jgi:hypothetical protein
MKEPTGKAGVREEVGEAHFEVFGRDKSKW